MGYRMSNVLNTCIGRDSIAYKAYKQSEPCSLNEA